MDASWDSVNRWLRTNCHDWSWFEYFGGCQWQDEGRHRAAAALAGEREGAVMPAGNLGGNRQPETNAAGIARPARVAAQEPIADPRDQCSIERAAIVAHPDAAGSVELVGSKGDLSAWGRILDRIVQQVEERAQQVIEAAHDDQSGLD